MGQGVSNGRTGKRHAATRRTPPPSRGDGGVWLNVPFSEKDAAKDRGAGWDRSVKHWFIPAGVATNGFERWMYRPSSEVRRAAGAGTVIGYWRNAIGNENLDALAKDADPVGPDRAIWDETELPEDDSFGEGQHLLLVGRFAGRPSVLLAVPLLVEPEPLNQDKFRIAVPGDALPRLNASYLEQPGAEPKETDIGALEAAEAWTAKAVDLPDAESLAEWIGRGLGLLREVTGVDPLQQDLGRAPGAMAGRTPLMTRLVPVETAAGPVQAIAGLYDAVLRMPAKPGLLDRPGCDPAAGTRPPGAAGRGGRPCRAHGQQPKGGWDGTRGVSP